MSHTLSFFCTLIFGTVIAGPISDAQHDNFVIDLTPFGDRIFGTPKFSTGDILKKWNPFTSSVNPEELGEYFEGDILFPPEYKRNGIRSTSSRWPGGVIPYVIEANFSTTGLNNIMAAIDDYHKLTCVQFVPRTTQTDYVAIVSENTGCWSSIGKLGGRQVVNLQQNGCTSSKGTAIHELKHALGFFHEQSRYDRDNYVTINFTNITPGNENNFAKQTILTTTNFGTKYDYGSVMHYSADAFSVNGYPTIIPKMAGVTIGQRNGLSATDIQKVQAMYCSTSSQWWLISFIKEMFGLLRNNP